MLSSKAQTVQPRNLLANIHTSVLFGLFLFVALFSQTAHAYRIDHPDDVGGGGPRREGFMFKDGPKRVWELEVHGGFDVTEQGLATGIRFHIPIVHQGILPNFNDAIYFCAGADFYWTRWKGIFGVGAGIPLTILWRLFFTKLFSLGIELGINPYLHARWFGEAYNYGFLPIFFIGAVTLHFDISPLLSVVVRLGSPYLSAGVSFRF
ncbi:MAG: hypothetical protein H6727_15745 [Myxococcales bacterium]|nr:hypothetical protein [Myxococcales bacterium]